MIRIKITIKDETRRFSVSENTKFNSFIEILEKLFGKKMEGNKFMYLDEENELITFSSDLEFQEVLQHNKNNSLLKIKLDVFDTVSKKEIFGNYISIEKKTINKTKLINEIQSFEKNMLKKLENNECQIIENQ
jgi:hypothetical protein